DGLRYVGSCVSPAGRVWTGANGRGKKPCPAGNHRRPRLPSQCPLSALPSSFADGQRGDGSASGATKPAPLPHLKPSPARGVCAQLPWGCSPTIGANRGGLPNMGGG